LIKYIVNIIFLNIIIFANDNNITNNLLHEIPKNMSTSQKKARFYALIVPPVKKVHNELKTRYHKLRKDIILKRNLKEINMLKRKYNVQNDLNLLYALYPHPPSITIAQGALESAWGTSRFFCEANNVFGIWSSNENESRISAEIKRGGGKTIWLRKFDSIEDSIRAYYELISKAKAFTEFRKTRFQSNNVFILIKKLDKYSEIGDKYTDELAQLIRYNKLTKYD
jgi:Bax protein